jgi:hypothetical protein
VRRLISLWTRSSPLIVRSRRRAARYYRFAFTIGKDCRCNVATVVAEPGDGRKRPVTITATILAASTLFFTKTFAKFRLLFVGQVGFDQRADLTFELLLNLV